MGQIGYFFNILFAFPIFNALMLLDRLFGDFGLSIIVLTLIIRLCLFPLTRKQLLNSKKMQKIQPLMADIRKKYPNDQRTQYEEMQALYKEYGINPLTTGCFPLLIQFPILIGMYDAMRLVLTNGNITAASISQYIYPFLPKFNTVPSFDLRWFTFLNPAWHFSLASPDMNFIRVLPLLAGLATFAQMRMSQAATKSSGPKDMMTQQMQLMSLAMPVVTTVIAWGFPTGLALYWTTTSAFSMVQQFFVTGWGSLGTVPILEVSWKELFATLFQGEKGKARTSRGREIEASKRKPQPARVVDATVEKGKLGEGKGRETQTNKKKPQLVRGVDATTGKSKVGEGKGRETEALPEEDQLDGIVEATGDKVREGKGRETQVSPEEDQLDGIMEATAKVVPESKVQANGHSTSSKSSSKRHRTRRPQNMAARRRGSSTPKRNPSRS